MRRGLSSAVPYRLFYLLASETMGVSAKAHFSEQAGRFWLKADSLPAQGTLGLNLATPASHLWQFGEAVFWSRSLCSSLKGFFKTVHFLARF